MIIIVVCLLLQFFQVSTQNLMLIKANALPPSVFSFTLTNNKYLRYNFDVMLNYSVLL
jgi:hypothetical protein